MVLANVKADGNVPFIGPQARYQLTGLEPAWIFLKMASGQSFNKKLNITAGKTATELEPAVEGGKATFAELTEGGIFDTIATAKKAHIIEAIELTGATLDIVRLEDMRAKVAEPGNIEDTAAFRAVPSDFPFKLAPGETVRANGGAAGIVGLLIREDGGSIT